MQPPYATLWARVKAFVLDYLVLAAYIIVLTVAFAVVGATTPELIETLFNTPTTSQLSVFLVLTLPVSLYFALSECSAQQTTWGKRRIGLQVTTTGGKRLGFTRSMARTLLKFVPWELAHTCIWHISTQSQEPGLLVLAGFVLVWVLVAANAISVVVNPRRQALYDWIVGTVVVRAAQ